MVFIVTQQYACVGMCVSAESVQSFIFYLYGKLNATHARIYADDNNKGYRGYKLYLLCLCDCAPQKIKRKII